MAIPVSFVTEGEDSHSSVKIHAFQAWLNGEVGAPYCAAEGAYSARPVRDALLEADAETDWKKFDHWTKVMNVRVAKDEVSFLFPTNISYASPAETVPVSVLPSRKRGGLFRAIAAGLAWIAEMPRRHAVLAQLEGMSDRELADIGLARGELSKVFEQDRNAGVI